MRIILADHHVQSHGVLKMLLEEQPEFDLIGEATDAPGLLVLAKKQSADLIMLDGDLPGAYIEELIARLHEFQPRPIVIVMSSEIENSRKLLKAGADAFVSKRDDPHWLVEMLQKYERREKKDDGFSVVV
jgi:two-component system, NarL family, nitrate/nitrite response regulator NarL